MFPAGGGYSHSFSRRLDPNSGLTKHHAWLDKQAQLIVRSKEEFIRHYCPAKAMA